MNSMVKKLRSRAGESIAEVLVALLISVLGVSLLVGMIGVSTRVINNSTEAMHRQYAKANALLTGPGEVVLTDTSSAASISFSVNLYEDKGEVVYYTPHSGTGEVKTP